MPRQKNDGRGRLGGRQAGTPNRDNPLKALLHAHSLEYFDRNIPAIEAIKDLSEKDRDALRELFEGKVFSQFELDLLTMEPADRAKTELGILQYHTPKMQAISADMDLKASNLTLADRLRRLAAGEALPPDNP